jgi:hypothetical protein
MQGKTVGKTERTDQDLSMKFVIGGVIALLLAIIIAPQLHLQWNLLGALLIVVIGFLFVTVSSHLTGEIGSSSCPTSGMTVATLLLTCLVFLAVGWTGPHYFVTALSIGGIVCIASSNGGTTSQDLKTGFLVGATPRLQQIAILAGTSPRLSSSARFFSGSTIPTPSICRRRLSRRSKLTRPLRACRPAISRHSMRKLTGHDGSLSVLHNEKAGVNSIVPGSIRAIIWSTKRTRSFTNWSATSPRAARA